MLKSVIDSSRMLQAVTSELFGHAPLTKLSRSLKAVPLNPGCETIDFGGSPIDSKQKQNINTE